MAGRGLTVIEAPASNPPMRVTLCAYCSLAYTERDEDGNEREVPSKCRRCGAPMDAEKAREYADSKALHTPPMHRMIGQAANR